MKILIEEEIAMRGKDYLLSDELFEKLYSIKDKIERNKQETKVEEIAKTKRLYCKFKKEYEKYKRKQIEKNLKANKIDFGENAPIRYLYSGEYSVTEHGIYNFNGIKICYQLIQPVAKYINMEKGTEVVKCAFLNRGRWQSFFVDRLTLSHNGKIVELSKRGLDVTSDSARFLVKYLNDMLNLNEDVIPIKEATSKLGWYGDEFIPYDGEIEFDGDDNFRKSFHAIKEKGSFDLWLNEMNQIRSNRIVKLLHATSLASVLLRKLRKQPFVTMVWGTTGDGKTVAAMTAMSFWGNPEKGHLMFTLNNTDNFYYRVADFFNDIPVFFDELETYKGSMNKLIMNITEGIDRGKAKADGGIQDTKTWNNAFIMTGEHAASNFNSGGGTLNRLIEVVSDGKIIQDGHKTVTVVKENYGFAGKIFIEHIKNIKQEDLELLYRQKYEDIMQKVNTEEKQAFNMALILLADHLACQCIFKGEIPLQVKDIEDFMFKKKEIDVSERAYDEFLNECSLQKNRFIIHEKNSSDNSFTSGNVMSGEFWGTLDEYEITINKGKFDKILTDKGFSSSKILRDWGKKGYIEKNSQGRNYRLTSIAGVKANYIVVKIKREDDWF